MDKTEKIYGLSSDLLFKNIFGRKKYIKQLLKDIFHEEIGNFNYSDKETFKENKNLSYSVCDLLLETEKEYIILELQNQDLKNIEARMAIYFTRIYSKQKINKFYDNVKPVKIRLILNYEYGKEGILKEYEELEKKLNEKFGIYFEIKIWNIKEALKKKGTIDYENALLFRLKEYTKEKAKEKLKQLKKQKRYEEIVAKIEMYNVDLKTYQQLKEEEMEEMNMYDVARNWRVEGVAEGKAIGTSIGEEHGKLETAVKLLSKGIDMSLVIETTGLKEEQIIEYQKECVKS